MKLEFSQLAFEI